MLILAHRGLWKSPEEQNKLCAIRAAFEEGFGVETDVRDCRGQIVISHNPPDGRESNFSACAELLYGLNLPLAINIKADGLARDLRKIYMEYRLSDFFVFDMSIPDMREQLLAGNPTFGRLSDVESQILWPDDISGIWLDSFGIFWYERELLDKLLNKYRVCIVSEELHGRNNSRQWSMLLPLAKNNNLMLCTDRPLEARTFFMRATS